jgi:hypothetical protein
VRWPGLARFMTITFNSVPDVNLESPEQSPALKPSSSSKPHQWSTRKRIREMERTLSDEDLEELVDKALNSHGAPPIITKFHPEASWLWRQWTGTVLEATWMPAAIMMCIGVAVVYFFHHTGEADWELFAVPKKEHGAVAKLQSLDTMWNYLLSMATFVNTFFLSQARSRHNLPLPLQLSAGSHVRTIPSDAAHPAPPPPPILRRMASGWPIKATSAKYRVASTMSACCSQLTPLGLPTGHTGRRLVRC